MLKASDDEVFISSRLATDDLLENKISDRCAYYYGIVLLKKIKLDRDVSK